MKIFKPLIRVCICGGRDYFDRNRVFEVLDYTYEHRPFILISGGATGADTLGIQWASQSGVPVEVFAADWQQHGRAAGPIRNRKMIESGIDVLIAFPGGPGTADMVKQCRQKQIEVVLIDSSEGVFDL